MVYKSHTLTREHRANLCVFPQNRNLSKPLPTAKMFRNNSFPVSLLMLLLFVHEIAGDKKFATVTTTPPSRRFTASDKLTPGTTAPPRRTFTAADDLTFWPVKTPGPNPNGAFCNIFTQDCPSGYKCVSEDLSSTPRCRSLDNNPDSVGDPCSSKGNNDGDTCDEEGMCIDGVCRPLCTGNENAPSCPNLGGDICHRYSGGPPLCEEKCDPIIYASCNGGGDRYCTTDSGLSGRFTCMHETGDILGLQGDSCVETSQCNQGFYCLSKGKLPAGFCDNNAALKCCTPLVEDAGDCPSGTVAEPLSMSPPPMLEHLMVCVL